MPEPIPGETYEPDTIQVNRGRERGLGVGQKDIDYQRDPTGAVPAERWVNSEPGPRVRPPDALPPELDPPPRGAPVPKPPVLKSSEEPHMPQQTARPVPTTGRAPEPQSPEPQAYAAPDAREASLAPPAAGEVVEEFVDDQEPVDDSFGEVQMGGDRRLIPGKDHAIPVQGRKTVRANKERLHSPVRARR